MGSLGRTSAPDSKVTHGNKPVLACKKPAQLSMKARRESIMLHPHALRAASLHTMWTGHQSRFSRSMRIPTHSATCYEMINCVWPLV